MFGRRNDGAEVAARLTSDVQALRQTLAELEVRLSRLAGEVQSALQKVEVWGAREVARQAAFEEATDKLYRTAERARKLRSSGGDGDASDSAQSRDADDAFDRLYRDHMGRSLAP